MPEEPWGITHLAFLYAQVKGKGWAFADAVFWGNDRLPFLHKAITNSEVLSVTSEGSLREVQTSRC